MSYKVCATRNLVQAVVMGSGGSPLEYGGGGGVGAWGDSMVPEHPALATGPAVEAGTGSGWDLAWVLEQWVRWDGIAPTCKAKGLIKTLLHINIRIQYQ